MEFINHLLPENPGSLERLDIFLSIFHISLILFMMFGAFFRRLVPYHFPVVIIVLISWLGIGWYINTIGYCVITDWHWQVKSRLGQVNLPPSYITYLYSRITGDQANNYIVMVLTGVVMALITILSACRFFLWFKNRRKL